jgi:hypothetical protein
MIGFIVARRRITWLYELKGMKRNGCGGKLTNPICPL